MITSNNPLKNSELKICELCGHFLTIVGNYYVCPTHGQKSEIEPQGPMRIFLSYGHDSNEVLVTRIKKELERRGHDVWFDRSRIKYGDDWRRSITEGILGSNRIVSFLSEHATRDPGVCLDEIGIAIGVKGGNIQTVLVENEAQVKPPASISHIQWLDMSVWKEKCDFSKQDWGEWFQEKLLEIFRVVESKESRRFAGEIEQLETYLKPVSSDALIGSLIAKNNVGRDWIMSAVEEWRISLEKDSRIFLMLGAPGVGKSTFAANLTHFGRDKVIAAHFIEWDKPDHRDPQRVIRSLAFQIATRLPDYRKLLLSLPEIYQLDRKNPSEMFDYLLTNPLHTIIDGDRERYLIIIDALDEASYSDSNPLADMIARHVHRLPKWLGLVVTSRPDASVTSPMQGLRPYVFDTENEANLTDIQNYLRIELADRLVNYSNPEKIINLIVEKSEGVFLYVDHLVREIHNENISLDNPSILPQGLGGIYYQYMQQYFPDLDDFRNSIRPILRPILAAFESLPISILKDAAGLEVEDLVSSIMRLGSLFATNYENVETFNVLLKTIRPFHKSLKEFLTNDTKSSAYFVSLFEGHSILGKTGYEEYFHRKTLSLYFSKHIIGHLSKSCQWSVLCELLGEEEFLRAISGIAARDIYTTISQNNPPNNVMNTLQEVPINFLKMCNDLRSTERIGLKDGLLPPFEAVSSCLNVSGELWETDAFTTILIDILVCYTRSLEIGIDYFRNGFWKVNELYELIRDSSNIYRMVYEIYDKDYIDNSTILGNLAFISSRLYSEAFEVLISKGYDLKVLPR